MSQVTSRTVAELLNKLLDECKLNTYERRNLPRGETGIYFAIDEESDTRLWKLINALPEEERNPFLSKVWPLPAVVIAQQDRAINHLGIYGKHRSTTGDSRFYDGCTKLSKEFDPPPPPHEIKVMLRGLEPSVRAILQSTDLVTAMAMFDMSQSDPKYYNNFYTATMEELIQKFSGQPDAFFLLIRHLQRVGDPPHEESTIARQG